MADGTMMGEVAPGKIAAKEVDTKKLMRRYCLLPLPISKPCLEINLNVLNIQPSFFSMCKLSSGQISSSLLGKPSKYVYSAGRKYGILRRLVQIQVVCQIF